jgi:hypothetical protein
MEQEIMEAITGNDVCLLCGETGSGKTTQASWHNPWSICVSFDVMLMRLEILAGVVVWPLHRK